MEELFGNGFQIRNSKLYTYQDKGSDNFTGLTTLEGSNLHIALALKTIVWFRERSLQEYFFVSIYRVSQKE